jgi:hypothetical protein
MNLLWLGDPKSFDVTLVGGKAANLSRLARMVHRVPDGFSLPVTVMDEAHPLDLRGEITAAFSDLMACHSLLRRTTRDVFERRRRGCHYSSCDKMLGICPL